MSANDLLLWMSARCQGSWLQFRNAVEELHLSNGDATSAEDDDARDPLALPLYQALRLNLQRLAHAEFFAGGGGADWRVTPPSLAVTQTVNGWLGVLAGARSPRLLQLVSNASTSATARTLSFPESPDQISFTASGQEILAALAERANLRLQRDAPASLLGCIPAIDDPSLRDPFPLPFGADWRIDRFSASGLRWQPATREDAASSRGGLFRFTLRHQRYMLLCSKGAAFRVPGQVGKFLVLRRRRRQVFRYDVRSLQLSIPAICRPPLLVERALILCSGSLPCYQSDSGAGTLAYTEVPISVARAAAALLRQELQ